MDASRVQFCYIQSKDKGHHEGVFFYTWRVMRSSSVSLRRQSRATLTLFPDGLALGSASGRAQSSFSLHPVQRQRAPRGCPLSLERVMRIELTTTAWEAVVLPLNYTRTSEQTPHIRTFAFAKVLDRSVVPPLSQKVLRYFLREFYFFNKLRISELLHSQKSLTAPLFLLFRKKFFDTFCEDFYYFITKLSLSQTEFCPFIKDRKKLCLVLLK